MWKVLPILRPWIDVPQSMFSMGDLWTGSIIVGASLTTSSSDPSFDAAMEVKVGLIDWEFASLARIGQDVAQLSARLYLFSMSSAWSSADPRCRRAVTDTIVISSASAASPGRFGSDSGAGIYHSMEGGAKPVTGETLG